MFLGLRGHAAVTSLLIMITGGARLQAAHPPLDTPFVTDKIDITLQGYVGDCGKVNEVNVVMSGDESAAFDAKRDPEDRCHWTATRRKGTFDITLEHFSLRLGTARTTCKPAKGDKGVARLVFLIHRAEVRQVSISSIPVVPISYVRGVPARAGDDPPSVPCVEQAPFLGQPIPIRDVWFSIKALHGAVHEARRDRFGPDLPSETLRVQLGRVKPDPRFPGLIVNDEAVTRRMNGNGGDLDVKKIVAAFGEERGRERLSMPQSFSSGAYDTDEAILTDLATDKLVVKLVLAVK